MVTFVLDASALLRFLLRQEGGERIKQLLEDGRTQKPPTRLLISAVNWCEVIGKVDLLQSRLEARLLATTLAQYGLEIVPASADRAEQAALIRRDWKLGYADAFCVQLASENLGALLLTADYDFKLVETLIPIEFLPSTSAAAANS